MKLLVLLLVVTGVISNLAAQKDRGARLVFFELTVNDLERTKTFYGQLFGWSFTESPSPEFVCIQGAGIAGGMLKASNKTSGKGRVKIFLEVENVGTTLKQGTWAARCLFLKPKSHRHGPWLNSAILKVTS